jgi:uncharacterized protein YwgA
MPLNRDDLALIVLSLAEGEAFTPVQVQKALFLATDKLPRAFAPNSRYDFQPYDYGPFDRQVYLDMEALEDAGLVRIRMDAGGRWKTYAATATGVEKGRRLAKRLEADELKLLGRIVRLVRNLSFTELVSAIYRGYPEMRARSIFRD